MDLPEFDHVHVWYIDLSAPCDEGAHLLDAREQSTAARFVHGLDRQRYVRTHVALRRLLGRYLNIAPDVVAIRTEPDGKPFLDCDGADLTFNLSHSHSAGMVAVGRQNRLGVDIEDLGRHHLSQSLTEGVFDAADAHQINALPACERELAFLRGWTRKEAVAKAFGFGLLRDPMELKVPLGSETVYSIQIDALGPLALIDMSFARHIVALAADRLSHVPVMRRFCEREANWASVHTSS